MTRDMRSSRDKMIDALLASGEVGNTYVASNPDHQPYSRAVAGGLVDNQRTCVVCGHGMFVKPWGEMVPIGDRIHFDYAAPGGPNHHVTIHRACLLDSGAGAAIAAAISDAKRPCEWDTDGRESVALARTRNGETVAICQRHLDEWPETSVEPLP